MPQVLANAVSSIIMTTVTKKTSCSDAKLSANAYPPCTTGPRLLKILIAGRDEYRDRDSDLTRHSSSPPVLPCVVWFPNPLSAFCHFRSSVATLLGTEVSLSLAFVILLVLRAVHRTYGFPSCTSICLTLSTSSLVRRWLKFRTVLRWSRRW